MRAGAVQVSKGPGSISDKMRSTLAQVAQGKARGQPVRATPKRQQPTPEQMQRTRFALEPLMERGQVIGHAYRRQPWFETLANRGDISTAEVRALRFYRNAFEGAFFSEVRSSLDFSSAGGGSGSRSLPTVPAEACLSRHNLALCETGITSPMIDTLRAIGLHDMKVGEVAMARFGSRPVAYIENGQHLERRAPKSGRHREAIRIELQEALAVLIGNLATMARVER